MTRGRVALAAMLAAVVLAGWSASLGADGGSPRFGEAIRLSPEEFTRQTTESDPTMRPGDERGSREAVPTGGFTVDTQSRGDVLVLYHCVYRASEDWVGRMGWVGDIANCVAGTVSDDFHDDTLRRINFFRAMSGLGTDITFAAGKNAKCQEAALIMSRNGGLSHYPIQQFPNWSCLSADGDEAAQKSNLGYGGLKDYTGPTTIDGLIEDPGFGNEIVGHRRWLQYSRAAEMGNGGIPGQGSYGSAAAVWVIGDFVTPDSMPEWTSWPNGGYVPYQLVYPRWSFSLTAAPLNAFNTATVSMTHNGNPVAVQIIHPTPSSPATGIADPTIVWEPQAGLPNGPPDPDITYTVTVSGITGTARGSYTYSVIAFDPFRLDASPVVSGPLVPQRDVPSHYTVSPVDRADAYELRTRRFGPCECMAGAEAGEPSVVDGTGAGYELIQTTVVRSGAAAFHLAAPAFSDQVLELGRTLLPGASSELAFAYRRRFMLATTTIAAQVSPDDGASWTTLWEQGGVCAGACSTSQWDPDWIPVTVPLSAYAGTALRVRCVLASSGSAFSGSDLDYGVFLDDIEVTAVRELAEVSHRQLDPADLGFDLVPVEGFLYGLAVSPTVGCHQFDYGPELLVAPKIRPTPVITWGGPAPIVYGTALGPAQLAATANAPGALTYDPGPGTILHVGTSQPLHVSFAPDNIDDWKPTEATVDLDVVKRPLTIAADDKTRVFRDPDPPWTWTADGLIAGDDMSVLSGAPELASPAGPQSPVPGSPYPIVLGVGTLAAADYTFVLVDGQLAITPRTPWVTWGPPAAIVYGTALGPAQLDPAAETPGTFTFAPPSGTVLPAGNHILSASFAPDDPDNWTAVANITSTLAVDRAPQGIVFPNPGTQASTDDLTLSAGGGGSGNPVTFVVSDGPAELGLGNELSFSGPGNVTITASQAGNANHLPAAEAAQTFDVFPAFEVTVTWPGRGSATLILGEAQGATDLFDTGLDETGPPPPPDGSGYAILLRPDIPAPAGPTLIRDIQGPGDTTRWLLYASPPDTGGAVQLTWNTSAAAVGRLLLLQALDTPCCASATLPPPDLDGAIPEGAPIDMKAGTTTETGKAVLFEIAYGLPETVHLDFVAGWNLVGSSVMSPDPVSAVLGMARARDLSVPAPPLQLGPEGWVGREPDDVLNPERAYWTYASQGGQSSAVVGILSDGRIRLRPGWNCITPTTVATAYQHPAIVFPIWRWNALLARWEVVPAGQQLQPGQGYCIRVGGTADIVIDTGGGQ